MKKRVFAALIAIIMLLSSFAPVTGSAISNYPPYIDSQTGKYMRWSGFVNPNGEYLAFSTDFDEMVDYFRTALKNRQSSVDNFFFATTDTKYAYTRGTGTANDFTDAEHKLFDDMLSAVFKGDTENPANADGGDYLFKSIKRIESSCGSFGTSNDDPAEGNERYYTFVIALPTVEYYTTSLEEQAVRRVCDEFSSTFIKPGATEYDKVKTIYDFVVRNCSYDMDVYNKVYNSSTEEYNHAHSAYGALFGGIDGENDFQLDAEESVIGLNYIKKADQGKAVCEGYSKLFYYLCVSNGIQCRIVDGDYTQPALDAGKQSDPHEWNYVYLDDDGDGVREWFQVDTTFSAQRSYKEINMNDYHYFLCGSDNKYFSKTEHQQPFKITGYEEIEDENTETLIPTIYDYYGITRTDDGVSDDIICISSVDDYQIAMRKIENKAALLQDGYIVRRLTKYTEDGEIKTAIVYSNSEGQHAIKLEDDLHVTSSDTAGFIYNGKSISEYDILIPYLDYREYQFEVEDGIKDVGTYNIRILGAEGTYADVNFQILPLDMNHTESSSTGNYDEASTSISNLAYFTGREITPKAIIVDGYENTLQPGVDYVITAYRDEAHTQPTVIKDIGKYYIDVDYISKNYSGDYYLTFTVEKADLSGILMDSKQFTYIPLSRRQSSGVYTPADFYKKYYTPPALGEYTVSYDTDVNVSSNGGLDWGNNGTITLTAKSGSKYFSEGTSKSFNYSVSSQYDISSFNGSAADTGRTNVYFYNGYAINPSSFDWLDSALKRDVEYRITSISNNVNAGAAEVHIEGINGCKGSATMYFRINQASIGNAQVSASLWGSWLTYNLTYNGKTLSEGSDYYKDLQAIDTGYVITFYGMNNFQSYKQVIVSDGRIRPLGSNRVILSANSVTYTGKAVRPNVTVLNGNGNVIDPVFYTVSAGSSAVGKGTVTITFKNGFSGSINATYSILPKNTTQNKPAAAKKGFTAKWKKSTSVNGYQIRYTTDKKLKSGFKNGKLVTKNKTTSQKITGLKSKKTYYIQIRTYKTVGKVKYYSNWSNAKKVKTK